MRKSRVLVIGNDQRTSDERVRVNRDNGGAELRKNGVQCRKKREGSGVGGSDEI